MSERIYIYKRYERFWHWSQAFLIIVMMITGFEVHGSYSMLGFANDRYLHALTAPLPQDRGTETQPLAALGLSCVAGLHFTVDLGFRAVISVLW